MDIFCREKAIKDSPTDDQEANIFINNYLDNWGNSNSFGLDKSIKPLESIQNLCVSAKSSNHYSSLVAC